MGIALPFKTVHVSAQIVGLSMKLIHIGMRILTLVVRVAAVVTVELMVAVDMAMALVVVVVLPVALLLGVFAGYAAVPHTHIRSAKSFSGGSKADFLIFRIMATAGTAADAVPLTRCIDEGSPSTGHTRRHALYPQYGACG